MAHQKIIGCIFILTIVVWCITMHSTKTNQKKDTFMAEITVTSSAFKDGEDIPQKYTCDGQDISPDISWGPTPTGTKSFVLICNDPDAPLGTWVHWVVFNIPSSVTEFKEHVHPEQLGAVVGTNSWEGKKPFGGPCPPHGTHRYYFTVYALSIVLNLNSTATRTDVEQAIKGHVLGQGSLMGRYTRQK